MTAISRLLPRLEARFASRLEADSADRWVLVVTIALLPLALAI